jgi:AcrR family transcriptional regulator
MSKPTGRRERKKDATRRAIADAGLRLFLERNFDQVTIAEIAEAADVSINTVFNYFPTKEDLFFGSYPSAEPWLTELRYARKPNEPVVAFVRRFLETRIEQYSKSPMALAEFGLIAAVRRVFPESAVLQVHAVQSARKAAHDLEDSFALALAKDVKAGALDLTPRLIAGQVIAICSTLFLEAERHRRAGEKPEKIQAILSASARTALNLLEKGIGKYGAKPR